MRNAEYLEGGKGDTILLLHGFSANGGKTGRNGTELNAACIKSATGQK
jgi:hypothetical protein